MHHGKWGWYPCDRETYHKLKKLNMVWTKALRSKAQWERWDRKEPQNRVIRARIRDSLNRVIGFQEAVPIPEPELSGPFCQKVIRNVKFGKKGQYYKDGCDETFVEMNGLPICDDYRKARFPVATEAECVGLTLSAAEIDDLYSKLV
jgi:hypothetical protein